MEDCQSFYTEFLVSEGDRIKARVLSSLAILDCRTHAHLLFDKFSDQSEDIQVSIIFAMRSIANSRARQILANLMSEGSLTVPVKAAMTEIIGDLGMSSCKPLLVRQLNDDSAAIRFWSCQSLGMIGNWDDLGHLQAMMSDNAIGHIEMTVADAARRAIEFITSRHS